MNKGDKVLVMRKGSSFDDVYVIVGFRPCSFALHNSQKCIPCSKNLVIVKSDAAPIPFRATCPSELLKLGDAPPL